MKGPLAHVRLGACILATVFLAAVIGYRVLGGYDWLDAVWLVVVTISTVGYGERSQLSPGLQLLTICVIVLGLSASAYTFGSLFQLILEGELNRLLGTRRMTREIDQLGNHVILCGFGRVGQNLAVDLRSHRCPFVVIENDPARLEEARSRHYLCLAGDAMEEDVLEAAGLLRAKTLVIALPTDAANVFITLTARDLNRSVQIIARAEHQSTEKKLRQAGANRVVMPAISGARQMVRMITRPSTADLMELVVDQSPLNVELDEISVTAESRLTGATVQETEAHRKHRLLVVAVKPAAGAMIFNPDAAYTFRADDTAIVMGHTEDIQRFRREYQLEGNPS